ncbi:MAG: 4-(cytidine 5'-diphospho)-2-C-methyl-D-erythritol kinase [Candidatus Gracilibacteria bacterium]
MTQTESKISVKSYPKINLALDILKKTDSGYHEIQTIFNLLPFPADEISIELNNDVEIEISCDNPKVPLDNTNTALKAAKFLQENAGIKRGAKINIQKNIPLMSGLGGGSSNAAEVLKALAQMWEIKCCADGTHKNPQCVLRIIADQIGMDCSFFFYGGTALGEHFGEKITPFPTLPSEIKFEIIETGIEVSSRLAYQQLDVSKCGKNKAKTERLIKAVNTQNSQEILNNIHNDFEEFIFFAHPKLREIKERELLKNPQSKIILCGSGGALCRLYS